MDTHDEKCEYQPSGIDPGMDSCRCRERRLVKRVNALREIAIGRVKHINSGRCPDFDNREIRDRKCPACTAIGERESEE